MRFIISVLILLLGFNVVGQNPTNYQYRAVRERSIAQMLDSSFHFPRYNATPSGLRVGSSANSGAGAIDTINHVGFFYSGDKWRAFGSQGFETRLVNGGKVTWDSLLVFSVAPAIYYINGAYYTSSQSYVTLDAANGALDRIDLIYLDSTGVHKETGVAAATPEEPSLPANSIRLTAILIPATATVPGGGVDTVTIYDENVEWTVSTTSLTAPSTDNTSPFHFITDIQTGAITNTSILKFTSTSAINVSSFTALRFYLKLKGTFNNSTYLTVYFVKSGVKICIPIEIKNGTYGFSRTNTTSYQQITIPISDFGFTSTAADGLWFQPSASNSSGFYMDWVQLQGGISQPVPSNTYTANLPIRITNNVISADTSRALAPSLATNAIVKKQIDSLAAISTGTGTVTSVSSGFGTNFSTITTSGSVVVDSTSGGMTSWVRTKKIIDSLNAAGWNKNIYNSDGTLTGFRSVSLGTNSLNFSGTGSDNVIIHTSGSSGAALQISSSDPTSVAFTAFITNAPTNSITEVAQLQIQTGTAATGIGISLPFYVENSTGGPTKAAETIAKWKNITNANRTSQYIATAITNANMDTVMALGDYVSLTESSATKFTSTTVGTGKIQGGQIVVTVEANDGTDFQSRTLRFIWSAVNKAGTLTITIGTPEEAVAVSAGTLTCTITGVDAGAGILDFKANAVSSLTQTTLRCTYQVFKNF